MLLPLWIIPELRSFSRAERRDVWRQALRDPWRWTDLLWLLLFLAMAAAFAIEIFRSGISEWLSALGWLTYLLMLDLVIILRYRPVLRRLTRLEARL